MQVGALALGTFSLLFYALKSTVIRVMWLWLEDQEKPLILYSASEKYSQR